MIRRLSRFLYLFFILFALSSCFELIEEVTIRKDGSGEVLLTLNLSQSRTKVRSIMLLDSIKGHKVPSEREIKIMMEETVAFLNDSKGISEVDYTLDLDHYIASVSFSFENVSDINQLTQRILKKNDIQTSAVSSFKFDKGARRFERLHSVDEEGVKNYLQLKDEDRDIFKNASYTGIYRFDTPVTSCSNPQLRLSKSGQALMYTCSAEDLILGKANLSSQISLSP